MKRRPYDVFIVSNTAILQGPVFTHVIRYNIRFRNANNSGFCAEQKKSNSEGGKL